MRGINRRITTAGILAAVILLIGTSAVSAQPAEPSFHPVANLSNTANQTSDFAHLATDGSRVFAVWREQLPALEIQEIRFRSSSNQGATFGNAGGSVLATVPISSTVFSLRIAVAGTNVLVLFSTGTDEDDAEVSLIRSGDGGVSFSAPTVVPGTGGSPYGDIAVNAIGEVHLVMEDRAAGEILHLRSTDGGQTFSAAVNISNSGDQSVHPRISVNAGNVAVVWQEMGTDGSSPGEIAFVYSTNAGVSFSSPAANLSASPGAASVSPAVAFLDTVHVVWTEDGTIVHRQSADGVSFTASAVLGVPPAGDAAGAPSVSGFGDIVNVAWTTTDSSSMVHGPFFRRSVDNASTFSSTLDLAGGLGGAPLEGASVGGGSPVKVLWPHTLSGFAIDSDVLFLREIACSASWKDPVNGSWTDATKWSHGAVPGAGDDVCIAIDGTYTVTVQGSRAANGITLGAAGNAGRATLKIEGIGSAIPAVLTVGNGVTNSGTITMTDSGAGGATLAVTSGGLTNTASGVLETLDGSGGGRTFAADLVNDGVVNLEGGATFNKAGGSYVNNGTFTVATTETLAISAGTFTQRAGTLDVAGTLTMAGGAFNYDGGSLSGTPLVLTSAALNIGPGSTGAGVFRMLGLSSTLSGNIAAAQTVIVEGVRALFFGSATSAVLTAASSFINAGTLRLTSTGVVTSGAASLILTSGTTLTNASTGLIETLEGSGGARTITGTFVNHGTIEIEATTTLNQPNGSSTNNNMFVVATGKTLAISDGTFTQNAGTLDVAGTLTMSGRAFNYNGGSLSGTPLALTNAALNIGPGSTGAGVFRMLGPLSTLSGNIASAQTVIVEGVRPFFFGPATSAVLTAASSFINAGTLRLTSTGVATSGAATLTLASGTTLTNASTGLIETLDGSGGGRTIAGTLVNHGTIEIEAGTTLNQTTASYTNNNMFVVATGRTLAISAGTFTQRAGTLDVAGTLTMSGGAFNYDGGSLSGTPLVLTSAALNIGPGSTGAGVFRMLGLSSTLSGNIAAAQTVIVEGVRALFFGTSTSAVLTAASSFINAGTLRLTSTGVVTSGAATLILTGGSTLTNASTGVIETLVGSAGSRTITGGLLNQGTLKISTNTTYSGGTLRNVSPGAISGGATLTLSGGTAFFGTGSITANITNSGQFNAGASPGLVNITGNYAQTAGGALNVEIGGAAPGTGFDQVAVSGTATLAGTLRVSLFGGFCAPGTFDVMTYASRSGDFTTKTGLTQGTLVFTTTPAATRYTLTATGSCITAPAANGDSYSVDEDTVLTVAAPGVLGNDTDPQSTPLTAVLSAGPSNGTLTLNANGSFIYTPDANFAGIDSFTYRANDGSENSNIATVAITVRPINDPPDAVDDVAVVNEDSGTNAVAVLANDTIVPDTGETLSITAVTQGANGAVAITGGGTGVTFTPNANFAGSDSFTYTISDGNGGTDTATVAVTVNSTNDPPDAVDDASTVVEDSGANAVDVLANDTTAPDLGETLSITAVTQGSNGAVAITGGGTGVTFIPNANFAGSDSFTYTISDGNGGTDTATVAVTVNSTNDPPDAVDDASTVVEDSGANAVDVLANDTIAPDIGETLSITAVTQGANGAVAITGGGTGVTFTPNANFNGIDSFAYTISDGNGGSATAVVSVTITAVNDAPVADNGAATTDEDTPVTVNLSASDVESSPLTYLIVDDPLHGTLVPTGSTVIYTPAPNYYGDDSFTFKVNDGSLDSNVAIVTLTVAPVNDAPVLSGVMDISGPTRSPLGLTVRGSDVEDMVPVLEASGLPAGATFDAATGVFSWTPLTAGVYPVEFTARDSGGLTASQIAVITVFEPNAPPSCSLARPSFAEIWPANGRMVGVDILGVTDPDGDRITILIAGISVNEPGAAGDFSGVGTSRAMLRATRVGQSKDGRMYDVRFTATDSEGATCDGHAIVTVPHDQGRRRN